MMTQKELAQKSGISTATLSKLINGKIKNPTLDTLEALKETLDLETWEEVLPKLKKLFKDGNGHG